MQTPLIVYHQEMLWAHEGMRQSMFCAGYTITCLIILDKRHVFDHGLIFA